MKSDNMKAKVLLIYPTLFRISGLPVGLASLSAVLKEKGYEVKIFSTTFYGGKDKGNQTKIRAERGMSKEVKDEEKYLTDNDSDIENDIVRIISGFKPDIIGISILEMVFDISLQLTRTIKAKFKDVPIIAGGIFPTFSPELVIKEDSIDIVCVGEGETPFVELCNRILKNECFTDIDGLWVKSDGKIYMNMPCKLSNINEFPYPDYTEFDERLFYKPMQGRMYKMVNIVTSRGCNFNCTFCAAPLLRSFFKEHNCGQYYRQMDMKKIINQLYFQIKKHKPKFIYFSSESFLTMSEKAFDKFIVEYENIGIPFWIQTRIETITKKRMSELKRVGMFWLSIGLEHGNEEFRKVILKRNYSNEMFIEKMEILRELNIGASINNMVGLPFETRELIFDTINLNRKIWLENNKLECNVFLFVPFRGCNLYDVCKENGLLRDEEFTASFDMNAASVLKFPPKFSEELQGLIRTFNLYVKLPEKYYELIRIAEQHSKEGDMMLRKLSKLV